MRRVVAVSLVLALALAAARCATTRTSFLEVRTTGDARVYGQFFSNRNFTGWK